MRALLGIDEGTSAVKAQLVSLDLEPMAEARVEKATRHPAPGQVEQDPEEILAAVVAAVAEVLSLAPEVEIVGCGLDHQGESVLAMDPVTGRALSPVITWQDKRAQPILAALPVGERTTVTDRSGLPLDPYFSAGKVAWLIRNGLPAGARVGTVDAWLRLRLGGGFATDLTTASRTQLARPGVAGWDPELLAIFGVDPALLPSLGDSVGELATLTHPSWGRALPLTAQVVDQQAALAGSGAVRAGMAKATFGTGVFVLAPTGTAAPAASTPERRLVPTVAWTVAGASTYAVEGGVFAAGAVFDWLVSLGLFRDAEHLTTLAGEVPSTAGVRLLPALSGLGAPWWEPDAAGVLAGLGAGTTRAHIARAAIEGIVHSVCDILDSANAGTPLTELRVDGGLTRSDLLVHLAADLTGLDIVRGPADATALGAALLAGVGAGVFDTVSDAADRLGTAGSITGRLAPEARSEQRRAWRAFVEGARLL